MRFIVEMVAPLNPGGAGEAGGGSAGARRGLTMIAGSFLRPETDSMNRTRFARCCVLLMVPLLPTSLLGCTTNPATGARQFDILSRQQEIALGDEASPELIEGYGGAVQSESLQAYVTRVGSSMVPHTEADYASLPWEFTLLDTDVINAFALPGGKVFITRGLAGRMQNEAQLAGVLGHEIGHVTAEHADRRISGQLMLSLGVATAAALAGESDSDLVRAGVPLLVGTGGQVFALRFGRQEEIVADRLGMRYMSRAGYDPRSQLGVMQILGSASDGPRGPEFLSTHPHPETRIREIRKLIQREYADAGPSGGRFEQRYRDDFIEPLDAYLAKQPAEAGTSSTGMISPNDPARWCAACAAGDATSE